MHPSRSCYPRISPDKSQCPCSSFRCRPPQTRRNGLHRSQLSLHPCAPRQEIRSTLQSCRCSRFPLHSFQTRSSNHARPLASIFPRLCSKVCLFSLGCCTDFADYLFNSQNRYKQDLTAEQKEALLEVLRAKTHFQITPEIRREIVHSVARGEEMTAPEEMEVEIQ